MSSPDGSTSVSRKPLGMLRNSSLEAASCPLAMFDIARVVADNQKVAAFDELGGREAMSVAVVIRAVLRVVPDSPAVVAKIERCVRKPAPCLGIGASKDDRC